MVYGSKHVYDNIYAVSNLSKINFYNVECLEQKYKEKYLAFEKKCKRMIRKKKSNIWYFRKTLSLNGYLPKPLSSCPY